MKPSKLSDSHTGNTGHPLLHQITCYCDDLLDSKNFEDYPGAVNGLQMENNGSVTRIGAAVDATEATIRKSISQGIDLLFVHHGLFWSPSHPWTEKRYLLLKLMMENNLAVYSSHLPLDAHPLIGNNILLSKAIGLQRIKPFYKSGARMLGFQGTLKIDREDLRQSLISVLEGPVHLVPGGVAACQKIGVVTGGAGSELRKAAAEGIDTFITGEGPHWSFGVAEELGLNVFYGGHYATETFGVKSLAAKIARKFSLPWMFIDHPTGL